jgi:GNAT superfamily N-acetyltransferase
MTVRVDLRWFTAPGQLDPQLVDGLTGCWTRVSNAGGAVGFPFLPVDESEVRRAVITMVDSLDDQRRLLVASIGGILAGWLLLEQNTSPLTRHWARVMRVQTDLPYRGRRVGRALMTEVERAARDDLALEQLHIELRGGLGLEVFYGRLGWDIVGRWPAGLRLSDGDDRDEILMVRQFTGRRHSANQQPWTNTHSSNP